MGKNPILRRTVIVTFLIVLLSSPIGTEAATGDVPNGVYFSAGNLTSLILKDDGTVWGSGFNENTDFGDGSTNPRSGFSELNHLSGIPW